MSLHLISDSGWSTEVGHDAVWSTAFTPLGVIRRPETVRAEMPQPRPEGQTEKRWRFG